MSESKWEFVSLVDADGSWMSREQRSIVDRAVHFVCYENTARSISEISHDRIWEIASIGEELPLSTSLVSNLGEVTEADIEWANEDSDT